MMNRLARRTHATRSDRHCNAATTIVVWPGGGRPEGARQALGGAPRGAQKGGLSQYGSRPSIAPIEYHSDGCLLFSASEIAWHSSSILEPPVYIPQSSGVWPVAGMPMLSLVPVVTFTGSIEGPLLYHGKTESVCLL